MKLFKKFLLAACATAVFTACEDEAHVFVAQDLLGFGIEKESVGIEPTSEMTLTPESSDVAYEICVIRNYYTAKEFPKQTAQIAVDPETTAVEGLDFTLSGADIVFSSVNSCVQQFKITIHSSESSEKRDIVLKLNYEYEETCPAENRQTNKLTIHLDP